MHSLHTRVECELHNAGQYHSQSVIAAQLRFGFLNVNLLVTDTGECSAFLGGAHKIWWTDEKIDCSLHLADFDGEYINWLFIEIIFRGKCDSIRGANHSSQ